MNINGDNFGARWLKIEDKQCTNSATTIDVYKQLKLLKCAGTGKAVAVTFCTHLANLFSIAYSCQVPRCRYLVAHLRGKGEGSKGIGLEQELVGEA